jgi:hypothetical protein
MMCILIELVETIEEHIEFSTKVRDHWEDQDVDGWTMLKWILEM